MSCKRLSSDAGERQAVALQGKKGRDQESVQDSSLLKRSPVHVQCE